MARCPSCDYPLPDDRERLGGPLPQLPRSAVRAARPYWSPGPRWGGQLRRPHRRRDGRRLRPLRQLFVRSVPHAMARPGRLQRLRAQRALETKEARRRRASRQHFMQGMLSLGGLGIGAWVLTAVGLFAAALLFAGGGGGQVVGVMAFLATIVAALGLAVFGIGSATVGAGSGPRAAASMILAVVGLLICCLHVRGVHRHVRSASIWQS